MVLADDPATGVPGLTDDPVAADALLIATLDLARQVAGVGRVLLVHPAAAEARLAARALGFRLWPQDGATPGERYANAFRQASELGYDGAVVIGTTAPDLPADLISQAVGLLSEHHGAVAPDDRGGIALLGLQEHQPTLFSGSGPLSFAELSTRAAQQRIRLVELPAHRALSDVDLQSFLAGSSSPT